MSASLRGNRPQRPDFERSAHWAVARRARCQLCGGKGWYMAAYPRRRIECPDRSHAEPVPDRMDWPDDAGELDGRAEL